MTGREVEACWRMVDAQPSGQPSCGTPDQRGAKKGSVLSAQVHCLPRHHFPDQEASIPPSALSALLLPPCTPPPYHQPSDKAYIDPRGFALAPSLPLEDNDNQCGGFLLVVSMATQDPDPKTVLGTTNFLRPTTRVFVRFGGCRQSSWVQGRWQG